MEPKPFASLSAGLLARKGAARPAMRRPFISGNPVPMLPASVQDDLGWNDMGDDESYDLPTPLVEVPAQAPKAKAVTAEAPTVVKQQEKLAEQMSQASASPPAQPKSAATAMTRPVPNMGARVAKAAFTLRLDPERHLRLRLACAVGNRSAQQIVTEALDAFLDSQPQLEALVQQIPANEAKGRKAKSK